MTSPTKFNCAPANCRHFISASCLCSLYRNPLQFFIFTLSLKHHSEDLFTIIFRSSIIHRGLPPKFCMRIVFDFFLGISSHHKRDWRQFAYAKFLGVNKVFYGQCENGEYVNNFYLYIYFLISQIKNVRSTFLKISLGESGVVQKVSVLERIDCIVIIMSQYETLECCPHYE